MQVPALHALAQMCQSNSLNQRAVVDEGGMTMVSVGKFCKPFLSLLYLPLFPHLLEQSSLMKLECPGQLSYPHKIMYAPVYELRLGKVCTCAPKSTG